MDVEKVVLVIPGTPVPRYRGRPMAIKGKGGVPTGKILMMFPRTMELWRQKVLTAALQRQAEIRKLMEKDPHRRLRIKTFLSFPKKRRSDANNCESLIFDGVASGIGWVVPTGQQRPDDSGFLSGGVDIEERTGREDGYAIVTILAYDGNFGIAGKQEDAPVAL